VTYFRLASAARGLRIAVAGAALASALAGCGSHGSTDQSGSTASQAAPDAGSSAAAGGSPAAGRRRMAAALRSLDLSDDQKAQIREITKAMRKKNAGADPATKRANYKAAIAQVRALLTPEQRAQLDAKMSRRDDSDASPSSS